MASFITTGDALNVLGVVFNSIATTAVMKAPETYDTWWLKTGFCVNYHADRLWDTELLCAAVLCLSALITFLFYNLNKTNMTLLQQSRAQGVAFSNLSHGLGHVFVYALGGPPPAVDFSFTLEGLGYCVVLFFFFSGALKAVVVWISLKQASMMAVAIIFVQYLLDVRPELAFTYSQSMILLSSSIGLLLLPKSQKQDLTYVVISGTLLPLFPLFAKEIKRCQTFLAEYGRHLWYDLYLSSFPLLSLMYLVQQQNGKKTKAA